MNRIDSRDERTQVFRLCASMLVAALGLTVGCSGKHETGPSPVTALKVERLDVEVARVGGVLIGRPSLSLRETGRVSQVHVREVRFTVDGQPGADIRPIGLDWIVRAGGFLDLLPSLVEVELALGTGAAASVAVTISYEGDDGQAGSAESAITVALPTQAPAADVRLEDVVVRTNPAGGYHMYVPTFRVVEVGGVKGFSVTGVRFDLIESGPQGLVPPAHYAPPLHVDAGGSLSFAYNDYGPPFEISSSVLVSRVRIVVSFVDDAGVSGSAEAVVSVVSGTR